MKKFLISSLTCMLSSSMLMQVASIHSGAVHAKPGNPLVLQEGFKLVNATYTAHIQRILEIIVNAQHNPLLCNDLVALFNYKDLYGQTALVIASKKEHLELVQTLLFTMKQASLSHEDIIAILNQKNIDGDTPFIIASRQGNESILYEFLFFAQQSPNPAALIRFLLHQTNNAQATALIEAAEKNRHAIITLLLSASKRANLSRDECYQWINHAHFKGHTVSNIAFGHSAYLINTFKKELEQSA